MECIITPIKHIIAYISTLPHQCALCNETTQERFICQPCTFDLPYLQHPMCDLCSLPLAISTTIHSSETNSSMVCGACIKKMPSFDKTICAFEYSFPVNALITQFKHHRNMQAGSFLSQCLIQALEEYYAKNDLPDAIVYIPLHWQRQLLRGFNQAEFIAKTLAKHFNIPLINGIKKIKPTFIQHTLNRLERLKNLKKAFKVHPKIELKKVFKGKHIAIVDDVMTTGATAETVSQLLIKNGAVQVDVLALARTPKT